MTLPLPSRLHGHLDVPYFKILGTLYEFYIHIASEDSEMSNNGFINNIKEVLEETLNIVKHKIKTENEREDYLWTRRITIEHIVNVAEVKIDL